MAGSLSSDTRAGLTQLVSNMHGNQPPASRLMEHRLPVTEILVDEDQQSAPRDSTVAPLSGGRERNAGASQSLEALEREVQDALEKAQVGAALQRLAEASGSALPPPTACEPLLEAIRRLYSPEHGHGSSRSI
eukprot:jgi/Tetstr1/459588/TSEL_004952.t1